MESKIVRRVQQVMNILPSFSPYPSSSLPLTTTDTKGSARDNEQKSQRLWLLERSGVAEGDVNQGCGTCENETSRAGLRPEDIYVYVEHIP